MKNLKIRVNGEAENREAQELLFKLNLEKSNWSNFNLPKFIAARIAENNFSDYVLGDVGMYKYKEITLPELRAMANPMKEYLEKHPDGTYSLVLRGDLCKESDILIPEGAIRARFYPNDPDALEFEGDFCQWWHDKDNEWINYENYSNTLEHSRVVWQREQDEPFLTPECTLNDQYAEIEEVRQAINKSWGSVGAASGGVAQASRGVDATLTERQSQYGCYEDVAHVTQEILKALRISGYDRMPATHKESMHMIASKMARLVCGDCNSIDGWHDISGYATLVERLIGDQSDV